MRGVMFIVLFIVGRGIVPRLCRLSTGRILPLQP